MNGQVTAQTRTSVKPLFTRVTSGLLQRCTTTTECDDCRKRRVGTLQRAAINSSSVHEVPSIFHDVLHSPGQPLDTATRAFMEPTLGHDFSSVRVHADAKAAESARAVSALAYTVGRDVVFGTGHYAPHTGSGRKLVAHELTHVVQQSALGRDHKSARAGELTSISAASHERQAEMMTDRINSGQSAGDLLSSHLNARPGSIQFQSDPGADTSAPTLTNPLFVGDRLLEAVLEGKMLLSSGKGKHVYRIQVALMNLGYALPIFGADSKFGAELASALGQFQQDSTIPVTEVLDSTTMDALDKKAPAGSLTKYPEYGQLLGDGLLDFTVGVGYDEGGGFDREIEARPRRRASRTAIVPGLKKRGFAEKAEADAEKVYAKAGMSMPATPGGRYFIKPKILNYQSNDIDGLVRLLTYKDPEVRKAFLEAMQMSDVSLYTGHGRYGSGPDFDAKTRGAGNILINPNRTVKDPGAAHMYSQLKKQGVTQPLPTMAFDQKYKIWLFDGCNTKHYLPAIRKLANVTPDKTDVFGWGSEIDVSTTGADVLSFIDGLVAMQSAQELINNLNKINRIRKRASTKGVVGEGLADNPASP